MMKLSFEFDKINGKGDLKERISNKFSALEKYLTHVRDDFHKGAVRVERGERFGYKVKVDMKLPGKAVVAEGKAASLLDAVDKAYSRSSRIIREYLERLKSKKR